MTTQWIKKLVGAVALGAVLFGAQGAFAPDGVSLGMTAAQAQTSGSVPGNTLGFASDSEMWRAVRGGVQGTVSIPDEKAGVMVQSYGDNLRAFRNGPMSVYGGYLMLGTIILLALFMALRGRIKIEAGPAGQTIERFNAFERFTHWLTASSFVVLALTGLNVLYGRYVLTPIIGKDAFAQLAYFGKLTHNYIAFAFMLGLVFMFVMWVRHNIPSKYDLVWLAKGGGLFSKGVHPPSKRFNAGQKIIFWSVIIGGFTLSTSGVMLLFPFEFAAWDKTFSILNGFGAELPTELTPLMETQLSLAWHGVVALVMIAIILAHIYIGSIGMEGAIDAVGSGQVDLNWAKEHHNMWVAELQGKDPESVLHAPHHAAE